MSRQPSAPGEAQASPLGKELKHIARALDKLEAKLDRSDDRMRTLEREMAGLKVWGGILSFLIPALFLTLLTRSLA